MIEHGIYGIGLNYPASYISKSNMTFFGGFQQFKSSIQQTLNLDDIKPSTRVNSDNSVFQDLLSGSYGDYIECFNAFPNTIFKFSPKPFKHFLCRLPMLSFNFNKPKTKPKLPPQFISSYHINTPYFHKLTNTV